MTKSRAISGSTAIRTRKPALNRSTSGSQWPPKRRAWYLIAAVAAFALGLFVYSPALEGSFVFDDINLPFASKNSSTIPLQTWLGGARPVLMASYLLNLTISGLAPYSYHVVNVLLHAISAVLVFLIVTRLADVTDLKSPVVPWLSFFAAAIFLLHPVQTESVAYIAGRSECLSAFFFLAGWCDFLYRPKEVVSWPVAIIVSLSFAAAVGSKEHTLMLPLVLLLTDYFWRSGFSMAVARRNWRLYGLLGAGALAAALVVFSYIRLDASVGFKVQGIQWYQYLFTQWRALLVYLRLFVMPYGQNADYDFPISRNPLDHGAIISFLILCTLTAAAFYYRKRYRLASLGFFVFLLLMAPTSSFVPVKDPFAERRLYLPMIGLLLISVELLAHVRLRQKTLGFVLAGICAFAAVLSYQRAKIWHDPISFWSDAAAKSPNKTRVHLGLAATYLGSGRCKDAVPEYERARAIEPLQSAAILRNFAAAEECAGRDADAFENIARVVDIGGTAEDYALMGKIQAKLGHPADALASLNRAEQMDPSRPETYLYRAAIFNVLGYRQAEASDYRKVLEREPWNEYALNGLKRLQLGGVP